MIIIADLLKDIADLYDKVGGSQKSQDFKWDFDKLH